LGAFVRGDVLVVLFPFTDLTNAKRRPAVVLQNLPGDDMILCMITGQATQDQDAIPLDTPDFADGTLQKPSYIRPARLFTGENRIVSYRAGALLPAKIDTVTDAVVDILRR
jgi:mRNA interferase MazF